MEALGRHIAWCVVMQDGAWPLLKSHGLGCVLLDSYRLVGGHSWSHTDYDLVPSHTGSTLDTIRVTNFGVWTTDWDNDMTEDTYTGEPL